MSTATQALDARLIELSHAGDEAAFDVIVERYRQPLTRHCARIVGEAAAQDAVQDTFITAWTALRGDVVVHALRPWLFTIAHRKALAALRDRRGDWAELPETLTEGLSSADQADRAERLRNALTAVSKLPEDQREALLSSAVHGRSGRQIACSMGVDEFKVRQLVHRARTTVRAAAAAWLIPPTILQQLLRRLASHSRRLSALSPTVSSADQAETTGRLLKLVATAVAGIAIAGTATVHVLASQHRAPSHKNTTVTPTDGAARSNHTAKPTSKTSRQRSSRRRHAVRLSATAALGSVDAATPLTTAPGTSRSNVTAGSPAYPVGTLAPQGASHPTVPSPPSVGASLPKIAATTTTAAQATVQQAGQTIIEPAVTTVTQTVHAGLPSLPNLGQPASGATGITPLVPANG
jgi:RNA polymerase sigma factor (sigma-70 family)